MSLYLRLKGVLGHHSQSLMSTDLSRGGSKGGDWGDSPPKTCECNFIHHHFEQFGRQHSRYQAILPLFVLSQQCREVFFISITV